MTLRLGVKYCHALSLRLRRAKIITALFHLIILPNVWLGKPMYICHISLTCPRNQSITAEHALTMDIERLSNNNGKILRYQKKYCKAKTYLNIILTHGFSFILQQINFIKLSQNISLSLSIQRIFHHGHREVV